MHKNAYCRHRKKLYANQNVSAYLTRLKHMLRETRLHRILALIAVNGHISTERLIKELGISRETARRDIIELENQGAARRVHGGLVALDSSTSEPSLKERRTRLEREKRAIARATVLQLQQGQTVFMDAGTTTTALAEELCTMPGLTIVTNSLRAAIILSHCCPAKHPILIG